MAANPGEEHVATLFGDVHYFYGPESDSPRHHRFDKGSYVYLFEDAQARRSRIEIANHPGTDDQDAFDGYLDTTHLTYSYNHNCLVSLTVGDVSGHEQWHLPTYDPRNETKYHYKLHSLDIYFWKQQDALQFVNGIRRLLPPSQVDVQDEPAPPPRQRDEVSSVVQQLERAALDDHTQAAHVPPPPQQQPGVPSFAPPPISAVAGADNEDKPASPPQFVPMAYNPAAPAAPETIRHREKTPPPEDGGVNPLYQTLAHDAATPFSPGLAPPGIGQLGPLSPGIPPPSLHSPPGAPSFPGPPAHSLASPGLPPTGFGHHGPAHPGLTRAATMPVHGLPSPGLSSPYGAGFPGLSSPPPAPSQSVPPTAGQQHTATPPPPPPPPGGFSQYSYAGGAPSAAGNGGSVDYSIHQQVYRPTENEAYRQKPRREPTGKLEERARAVEKGATGMFKKFEKKFL